MPNMGRLLLQMFIAEFPSVAFQQALVDAIALGIGHSEARGAYHKLSQKLEHTLWAFKANHSNDNP